MVLILLLAGGLAPSSRQESLPMPDLAPISNMVVALNCPPTLADPELHVIRAQAALVRTLLAELEEVAPPRSTRRLAAVTLAAQTTEELAQLACKMMSAATSMAPQRVAELQLEQWPAATASTKY